MSERSSAFGGELRTLRERRGLSLQKLAEQVLYTKGYLSKVELGDKPPSVELAHRCDQVLEAGGHLIALAAADGLGRLAQLPAAASTFVGREAQLDKLRFSLAARNQPGTPRTVTIDGPPGVGKTALAVYFGHSVRGEYPDGQLHIDLRGYSDGSPRDPIDVLEEFLGALGIQTDVIPASLEQRAGLYRSLLDGRRVLIVLDNARDSHQITPLLPGSDGCAVVVTSRRRLEGLPLRPDQRITLDLMPEQESLTLLRMVIGPDRADVDPNALRELANRCGHWPLALRIAASRAATRPHQSIDELVEELDIETDRLDALATEDSVAVRTVFSWSYRDLNGEAAQMFRLLGLHPGPQISAPAAAALAGMPPAAARRVLDRLVGVHLLEGIAGDRYRVHDLLRMYAAERAAAEETEAERAHAVHRVLIWYLHTAYAANHTLAPQRHDPVLEPPDPELPIQHFASYDEALTWCEIETPQLVAATTTALAAGHNDIAWQLPVGCFNFLQLRKRWRSWIVTHETGVEGAHRAGDRYGEAWALNNLSSAWRYLRQYDSAADLVSQALKIRRKIGDRVGEAWSLAETGAIHSDLWQVTDAVPYFQEAAEIFAAAQEQFGEGFARASLGDCLRELGRLEESLTSLHRALAIFRATHDTHGIAYTQVKLGDTYSKLGQLEDAWRSFHQSIMTRREVGDRWGEAEALSSRGRAQYDCGQADAATDSWREALAIFDELGDPRADDIRAQLAAAGVEKSV